MKLNTQNQVVNLYSMEATYSAHCIIMPTPDIYKL